MATKKFEYGIFSGGSPVFSKNSPYNPGAIALCRVTATSRAKAIEIVRQSELFGDRADLHPVNLSNMALSPVKKAEALQCPELEGLKKIKRDRVQVTLLLWPDTITMLEAAHTKAGKSRACWIGEAIERELSNAKSATS